ncbi:polyol transporter 5-like [Vigna umbellata]|uniref:polyol transporter 5-like n=1 Tax=Vigna umbellata TaxID=87088 RepID=UPI001F5E658B|nr:polyol transporter 5-like [Vigna umbellata]
MALEEAVSMKQDFDPQNKPKRNKFALACAILASMTSILLGYDIGVMSGAALYIQRDLRVSDVKIEILNGIINLYSPVGSFIAGRTSDWIGRRYTIALAGVIFFVGAILMGFSPNYAFLMFGRFFAGVGVGFAFLIAPVYTSEISPTSSRGLLTSLPEIFLNGGILIGYISNYGFSKMSLRLGWRLMLGVGAVPAMFLAAVVLVMPESPRWLVAQGRLGEAKKILYKISDSEEEARLRLADIKETAGIPQDCDDDVVLVNKQSHGQGVWKELFLHPTRPVLHIFIASLGIHFFAQATGIDAVVLYSPRIFHSAGIKSDNYLLLATVAVGFVKTVSILVATFLLDRAGRRVLLLCSVSGLIFSLVTLGVSLTVVEHSRSTLTWAIGLSIAAVLAYVATFSIGSGPITWVYSSEIFPLRLRAQGVAIGAIVNRVTSGVIAMTFLSLCKAISTGGAFFLFAAIAVAAWIFHYTMLPETRGKTLEEIEGSFGHFWRNPKPKGLHGTNGDIPLTSSVKTSTNVD